MRGGGGILVDKFSYFTMKLKEKDLVLLSTQKYVLTRVNVGTFGHSRVQLLLGTRHVVQYIVSNDI